jgi:hypothetical protein
VTPERTAALVTRWARFYTRDLPASVAQRRVDEIAADVRDHITHERTKGGSDARIGIGIASRLVRGLAADVAWRGRHTRGSFFRPVLRVGLGVALILALPLVAMQFSDEVVWSLTDFVLAGVLLAIIGFALELAAKKAGNRIAAVAVATLGVAAAVFGNADDAPGLVLLGLVLIASACALGLRTAQRES